MKLSKGVFEEVINWWIETYKVSDDVERNDALTQALIKLEIISEKDTILRHELTRDWERTSEEYYSTFGTIEVDRGDSIKHVSLAAYAVVTPPPISIEDRINQWIERIDILKSHQANVPEWYFVWKGTILLEYPPFSVVDFIRNRSFFDEELIEFSQLLNQTFWAMAETGVDPLGLKEDLRTDGLNIFYCGLGYDMGAVNPSSSDQEIEERLRVYEDVILKECEQNFINHYRKTFYLE